MNTHTEPKDKSCIPPQQTTTRGIRRAYLRLTYSTYVHTFYYIYVQISFSYTLVHRVDEDVDWT